VRYRLAVRLAGADVGQRVVIRWRRPGPDDGEQIADVLGILEEHDANCFAVRTSDGQLVVIPHARALRGRSCRPRGRGGTKAAILPEDAAARVATPVAAATARRRSLVKIPCGVPEVGLWL